MKVLSIVAIGSSVVFFGFGCKETQSPENKAGKNVLFDLQVGEISIQTELALLPEERRKGLMHRDRLDEGKGMFFIFEKALALNILLVSFVRGSRQICISTLFKILLKPFFS